MITEPSPDPSQKMITESPDPSWQKKRGANRCGWLPIDFRLFRIQSKTRLLDSLSYKIGSSMCTRYNKL
jgi:hypothetical protein